MPFIAIRTVCPEENALVHRKVGKVRFGLYPTPSFRYLAEERCTFIAYDQARDHLPQQVWLHQLRGNRSVVFAASDLASQQMAARLDVGAVVLPTIVRHWLDYPSVQTGRHGCLGGCIDGA